MRASAVEHEAEEKVPARAAESPLKDGAVPVAELNGGELVTELAAAPPAPTLGRAPQALFHPRLLLGLQARAGNAAVAGLIEERRKPEPRPADHPVPAPAPAPAPESPQSIESAPAATLPTEAEAPSESAPAPRAGESDDALATLDTAADAAPVAGEAEPADTRELVASDAQAELADAEATSGGQAPEAPGGAAEPGAPIEARRPPVAPDVSTAEPSAGLARVGSLPPAQLLGSLGSVAASVDRDVVQEHDRLAANPPQRPRHPGAPSTVETPASTRVQLGERATGDIPKVAEGHDAEVRRPAAPPVAAEAAAPNGQLPAHDPGLELKPGPLPDLPLAGNADPAAVQQQQSHVQNSMTGEHAAGQRDAVHPMGEDEIFPAAPAETLRAAVAQAPGANGHGAAAPAEDDEAASIVAQQEKGGEIQSAVSGGLATLASQRQEHEQRAAGERAKADAEMAHLEQENAGQQAVERATAKREVLGIRTEWSGAQQELVAGGQREADAKTTETLQTVAQEKAAAEQQAATHYEQGQREADQARREGEQQAAAERKKAQAQGSGGLLGAIGSAAQSLFDKAKQAVQGVFEKARQLVRGAIERAQQLATAVMERARQAIVGAVRLAGSALVAIGDRVLVAFPALRNRFRKAIQDRIAAAEAVVNKLANVLKQAVQTALNLLGTALSAAIGLLQKGMQAAIDGVRAAVRGALDFARGALAAFGTFAVLVKDIAANPGQWISNLAAAVKDGLQNYLWVEIKTAVQGWFSDKVQEVVGVGQAIWHLLQRGGISIAEIARMVWEGLKAAIPGILIALLIEKLMSLIVPAVGAILTIIQSIQAAWGSLGRILQAFETFFAFLKQVKLGNAGPQFAKAVAAGAIAAVEFVSNFLLTRLKGAASSVSNRLRALARRIGERLAAIGRGIVKGARAVGSAFRRAGRRVRAGFDRLRGKRPKSHADQERAKLQRQEGAFAATKAKLDALFSRGISRVRLAAEVALLRVRYRWGSLRLQGDPQAKQVEIIGGFSPEGHVTSGPIRPNESLEALIGEDLVAQSKLRFVRRDPFISAELKADFVRKVETLLRHAKNNKRRVSPYEVMKQVVADNTASYRLLGDPITPEQIRRLGGLSRLISLTHVWDNYLPDEYQLDFGTRDVWLKAIRRDRSKFDPRRHLVSGLNISGINEVGFWYARYRSAGATTAEYVKRLQLTPARYPLGALRFELRSVPSALTFRRPTAFDGMPHVEWAPALRRDAIWGIVPGMAPKIREAVSGPVPVSAISSFELILP